MTCWWRPNGGWICVCDVPNCSWQENLLQQRRNLTFLCVDTWGKRERREYASIHLNFFISFTGIYKQSQRTSSKQLREDGQWLEVFILTVGQHILLFILTVVTTLWWWLWIFWSRRLQQLQALNGWKYGKASGQFLCLDYFWNVVYVKFEKVVPAASAAHRRHHLLVCWWYFRYSDGKNTKCNEWVKIFVGVSNTVSL